MLSLGSPFILANRIGDIFGRRRTLLVGIGLFGIASAGCALAPSLGVLVALRVLQGAGAAVIFPVGIAALSNEYSDTSRGPALGLAFGRSRTSVRHLARSWAGISPTDRVGGGSSGC